MAAPSPELLAQATEVAARIAVMGRDLFRGIWLTDWRKLRFVYDTTASQQCDNNCTKCRVYKLRNKLWQLQLELELPFITSLREWTNKIDKDRYGPERFLSCKTAGRQAQCFSACMLCDPLYANPNKLREEIELVRDLRVVYETGSSASLQLVQRHIVKTVSAGADWARRQHLPAILKDLGWNGKIFE